MVNEILEIEALSRESARGNCVGISCSSSAEVSLNDGLSNIFISNFQYSHQGKQILTLLIQLNS